jgi:hypothetical protein
MVETDSLAGVSSNKGDNAQWHHLDDDELDSNGPSGAMNFINESASADQGNDGSSETNSVTQISSSSNKGTSVAGVVLGIVLPTLAVLLSWFDSALAISKKYQSTLPVLAGVEAGQRDVMEIV